MTHHRPGHGPARQPPDFSRAFASGMLLNLAFLLVEVAFGLRADSLALLADAAHNFSDVLGLGVAWGANRLARRQPTDKYTYGFRRSSILAALLNALLLLVAIGGIVWEALGRLWHPVAAHAPTIIWVAAAGAVINTATALMFRAGRKTDLNVRGAFWHMTADAAISAGVVIAGILIAITQLPIIDPLVSMAVAAIIFAGTWGLLRESLDLAVDAVPAHIRADQVARFLAALPTVQDVHHLHIWALSTTEVALTAHLVLVRPDEHNALLSQIRAELRQRFGVSHATIQFESSAPGSSPPRSPRPGLPAGRGKATLTPGNGSHPSSAEVSPTPRPRVTEASPGGRLRARHQAGPGRMMPG